MIMSKLTVREKNNKQKKENGRKYNKGIEHKYQSMMYC